MSGHVSNRVAEQGGGLPAGDSAGSAWAVEAG